MTAEHDIAAVSARVGAAIPPPASYRFSRADLWRLARVVYRPSWTKRLLAPLGVLVLMLAIIVYGIGQWPSGRQWAAAFARWELVAMVLALLVFAAYQHLISMAFLMLRYRSFAIADKTVALAFGDQGLDSQVEGIASHVPWQKFTARIEEPDRVFLKIARWEVVLVPRRAFPDAESYRSAVAFLREKVPHGPS